jgi:hypothetical protein
MADTTKSDLAVFLHELADRLENGIVVDHTILKIVELLVTDKCDENLYNMFVMLCNPVEPNVDEPNVDEPNVDEPNVDEHMTENDEEDVDEPMEPNNEEQKDTENVEEENLRENRLANVDFMKFMVLGWHIYTNILQNV